MMNLFGNKPEEKAMASLIHDTNSALSELRIHTAGLSEWLRKHSAMLKEHHLSVESMPYIRIEYLKSVGENMKKAIDAYYIKAKADFKDDTIPQGKD